MSSRASTQKYSCPNNCGKEYKKEGWLTRHLHNCSVRVRRDRRDRTQSIMNKLQNGAVTRSIKASVEIQRGILGIEAEMWERRKHIGDEEIQRKDEYLQKIEEKISFRNL